MERSTPFWRQRLIWTGVMAAAALAFWIVGLGAGMRGWILSANAGGIVSHAQGFGEDAYIWWIPACILTLTAVVMAIGISIVRHLVDGPVEADPELGALEPKEKKKALPPKTPLEPSPAGVGAEAGDSAPDS